MEVWVNADEMEPRLDVRGVTMGNDLTYGDLTLVGDETDVIALVKRIADLYGYEVSMRDPGPPSCRRCAGAHSTEAHDGHLFERIAAETSAYNEWLRP